MASNLVVNVNAIDVQRLSYTGLGFKETLGALENLFLSLMGGSKRGSSLSLWTNAVQASGTLTIASGTGTVGGTIGGTAVTVTWATSDTATATALAAAINAQATVSKWLSASAAAGVVTLTVLTPGFLGNNVTLTATGTGVAASGTRLTGGTNDAVVQMNI